ncbi:MAG: hypothetical protein ACJ75H_12980 [Thermoanaerobaculia bacterium]
MKKKMEKIGDELFRPLNAGENRRVQAGVTTTTATTIFETYTPSPDFSRDGDRE